MSDEDTPVQQYLNMMAQLESEYPNVHFVYMTGHTDGGSATLEQNNNLVRQYVQEHEKILYDFADIESYDPDGNHYPSTDDSCPWCYTWCGNHPEDCQNLPTTDDECQHSHGLNCKLKGQALWWLSARLAAEMGNPRVANVILLGILSCFLDIPAEVWHKAIEDRVPPRFHELNRRAFDVGRE